MLVTSLGPFTDLWWDKSEGKTKWSQRVEQILGWERCDVSTQRHHHGQTPSIVTLCVLAHNVRKSRLRKRQKGQTFLSGGLMVINHANRRYIFDTVCLPSHGLSILYVIVDTMSLYFAIHSQSQNRFKPSLWITFHLLYTTRKINSFNIALSTMKAFVYIPVRLNRFNCEDSRFYESTHLTFHKCDQM